MKELILDIEYDNYTIPSPKAKTNLVLRLFLSRKVMVTSIGIFEESYRKLRSGQFTLPYCPAHCSML